MSTPMFDDILMCPLQVLQHANGCYDINSLRSMDIVMGAVGKLITHYDGFPSYHTFWRWFWNHTPDTKGAPVKLSTCQDIEHTIRCCILAAAAAARSAATTQVHASSHGQNQSPIHVADGAGGGHGSCILLDLGNRDKVLGFAKGSPLCEGLHGRHLFTRGIFADPDCRAFDWVVCNRSAGILGTRMMFKVYEVLKNSHGLVTTGTPVYGETARAAWDKLYQQETSGKHHSGAGFSLCGLHHPHVVALLAAHAQVGIDKRQLFGMNVQLSDMCDRRLRKLRAEAGAAFLDAMETVCPTDPVGAFRELQRSSQWTAKWMPERVEHDFQALPLVAGLVQAYRRYEARGDNMGALAILSLFAPHHASKVTTKVFGVNQYRIKQAILHAADRGAGMFVDKMVVHRARIKPRSFAFLYEFTRSVFAVTTGDPGHGQDLQRTQIRSRLFVKYRQLCLAQGIVPASKDHFTKTMRHGFADTTVETCCCSGCMDGWNCLESLREFMDDIAYGVRHVKEKSRDLDEVRRFMDGPFRWDHLQQSSNIATHCLDYALSHRSSCTKPRCKHDDPTCMLFAYCQLCDHEHENTCLECNQFHVLVDKVKAEVVMHCDAAIAALPDDTAIEAARLEKARRLEHLELIRLEFVRWMAHVVRKHINSGAKLDTILELGQSQCLIIIDYKCKPLPRANREGQTESFGKKGKSLFGFVAVFRIPDSWEGELAEGCDRQGDQVVYTVRVCCDDSDQDWFHSLVVFRAALTLFVTAVKDLGITGGWLCSDGASNFKSLSFALCVRDLCSTLSFRLLGHLFPEAGGGKDLCDRDFADINRLFNSFLKQPGASLRTADDFVEALDALPQTMVLNCAVKFAKPPEEVKKARAKALKTAVFATAAGCAKDKKSKDALFFIHYEEDDMGAWTGMRVWGHKGIGAGKFIGVEKLKSMWPVEWPDMSNMAITFTAGATPSNVVPVTRLKIFPGREHKKVIHAQQEEKKQDRAARLEKVAEQAAQEADANRTSFRCENEGCSKAFVSKANRDLHSVRRCHPPLTLRQRQQAALKQHVGTFETLQGATHAIGRDNDQLFALAHLCPGLSRVVVDTGVENNQYSEAELHRSYPCFTAKNVPAEDEHVPGPSRVFRHNLDCSVEYSVVRVLWGCIDMVVSNGGDRRELPGRGWATKEACARPSDSYSPELISELRRCFDAANRMNQFEIAKHLKQTFQIGRECLKATQVQGWVAAEVARRKRGALQEAGNYTVLAETVEADTVSADDEEADEVAAAIEVVQAEDSSAESSHDEGSGTESEVEEYEVRDIVDKREIDGVVEYKVLWHNFEDDEFSWEPRSNIENVPKILSAFEHQSGPKKRKRGAGMDFCGLRVLVDLKCTEDTPAWWRSGLDKYMGKYVCLQREDSMLEGKVTRYVMSAAPGETNVPAIFEIQSDTENVHLTKRQVDDGMTKHAQMQRAKRGRGA